MDFDEIATRALKTFVQAFVATFSVAFFSSEGFDSKAAVATAVAALAAAVSAAWNTVQSEVAKRK